MQCFVYAERYCNLKLHLAIMECVDLVFEQAFLEINFVETERVYSLLRAPNHGNTIFVKRKPSFERQKL